MNDATEPPSDASSARQAASTGQHEEMQLDGQGVSPGLAVGPAFIHRDIWEREPERTPVDASVVEAEITRVREAFEEVSRHISDSSERTKRSLGDDLAAIFEAHLAMLEDSSLLGQIEDLIRGERASAEAAVRSVFKFWEGKFLSLENELLREKAGDVADLARQLLRALAGVEGHSLRKLPEGCVLIAKRILPSEVVHLERRGAVAIVVEEGGAGSHCSLLARGMGIPKVARVEGIVDHAIAGDTVLVDGDTGMVVLSPAATSEESFRARVRLADARESGSRRLVLEPAVTRDGLSVGVMANISNRHDAELAAEYGADGVGLFRTEGVFLRFNSLPSEEERFDAFSEVLEPMQGKPVVLRLLDIGGDKQVPYLNIPQESDPFLGRRGIRLLLDFPELLASQLRVFLKLASHHEVRILVPMVTDLADIKAVKTALRVCADQLGIGDLPQLGAMIETPAAALLADEICAEVDFISIGSNDLTQYIMAAARGNPLVSRYYQDRHPAVLRMIRMICETADAMDTPVSLCGTLAAWEDIIPDLLRRGIRTLSVAPPLIPTVKEAVRASDDAVPRHRGGNVAGS